ncbi:hypothetical protein MANES_13G131800v8 [Manihot esculenta]|uniref:Uncharacterized protein n=1 Tax=Manihot esculenta TaxID=3983 RepID=A0A2C9URM3_MANES|nr:hypothetical protein MANES_13G131800v8 [Manihot esculenta]
MSFVISQSQQSLSAEDRENQLQLGPISTQIHLKSSSSSNQASSSSVMDREVILRRIRHHKTLKKVQNAFQALISSSEHENMVSKNRQRWLDHEDCFSSP